MTEILVIMQKTTCYKLGSSKSKAFLYALWPLGHDYLYKLECT